MRSHELCNSESSKAEKLALGSLQRTNCEMRLDDAHEATCQPRITYAQMTLSNVKDA